MQPKEFMHKADQLQYENIRQLEREIAEKEAELTMLKSRLKAIKGSPNKLTNYGQTNPTATRSE